MQSDDRIFLQETVEKATEDITTKIEEWHAEHTGPLEEIRDYLEEKLGPINDQKKDSKRNIHELLASMENDLGNVRIRVNEMKASDDDDEKATDAIYHKLAKILDYLEDKFGEKNEDASDDNIEERIDKILSIVKDDSEEVDDRKTALQQLQMILEYQEDFSDFKDSVEKRLDRIETYMEKINDSLVALADKDD